jgi:hypothetical protein
MNTSSLAPCPLPSCGGEALDMSDTTTERVMCQRCGLTLTDENAVDRWNDRPARLPPAIVMGVYERIRAKHAEPFRQLDGEEVAAVLEFANALSAAITPSDDAESVNVGVGLWVHGEPEAVNVLRNRLSVDPEEQVPEPLALIQAAEQAGFIFEGNTYRCSLPDIAKLIAATTKGKS